MIDLTMPNLAADADSLQRAPRTFVEIDIGAHDPHSGVVTPIAQRDPYETPAGTVEWKDVYAGPLAAGETPGPGRPFRIVAFS